MPSSLAFCSQFFHQLAFLSLPSGNLPSLKRHKKPGNEVAEVRQFLLSKIANTLPDIKMEQSRGQSFGQSFKGELG